jgi:molecular chaperone DnaJ
MANDFYKILGVEKNATPEEIKKAYRRKAHEYHPDKGLGNEEKFKEVNEAYQVLSNDQKKQQYDQFGTTFNNGAGFSGFSGEGGPASGWDFNNFASGFNVNFNDFSGGDDPFDVFSSIFGTGGSTRRSRRERGVDLEMLVSLDFLEAVFGVEKEIELEKKDTCKKCHGSGAEEGSKIVTCPRCHGTGQIKTMRRTILGQMSSVSVCDHCRGDGKLPERACRSCGGSGVAKNYKTLKIKIPAGVDNDSRIRVVGEGEAGYRGSNFGDLYLKIKVKSHPQFKREGTNIFLDRDISVYQAILGANIRVPTVDGEVDLKIPAGTQSGKTFRLKNKGVMDVNGNDRGDQFVNINVVIPSKLSRKEKEIFKQLAQEKGEASVGDEGFWSNIVS